MFAVFCADPLVGRTVDSAYADEATAARAAGLDILLVDYEALVDGGDPDRAVRRVPAQPLTYTAVYRGWMMRPADYTRLYDALLARGVRLINDPTAYRHCHYLPAWYPLFQGETPRSVWTDTGSEVSMDRIMEQLAPFGDAALILKDFVKSRKHEWAEACFIPSAADRPAVERVVRRFVELQGDDLEGGLVFREYVEFQPLTAHPASGMPLVQEYRLFFLNGALLSCTPYWEVGEYDVGPPPLERFGALATRVQSRFFTMDVARTTAGDWLIIELGDGQVAGLPTRANPVDFYARLREHSPGE